MKRITSPLWLWAGISNANAPTGTPTEAVVIEMDGTIRAALHGESQGNSTVVIVVSEADLRLVPGSLDEVRNLFKWQGKTVEGWACDLETLKRVVVSGVRDLREAKALARRLAHRDRLSSLTTRGTGGGFLAGLMQTTETRFLAGENDPAAVLTQLDTEISTIRVAALARGGDAELTKLEAAARGIGGSHDESEGDDGYFDDDGDGDEEDGD